MDSAAFEKERKQNMDSDGKQDFVNVNRSTTLDATATVEPACPQGPQGLTKTLKRRGIFAGLAALAAGILAHKGAIPAEAAGTVTLANDVGSTANNETVSTYLHNTGSNVFLHTDAAVLGESDHGPGVYGSVNFASTPQVPFSSGVYGDHGNANGVGVHGLCAAPNGTGVMGTASDSGGFGVIGKNMSGGVGVYGQTSGPNPAIQGFNPGSGPGLQGFNSGSGIGLQGTATGSAPGVQGYNSGSGPGVVGQSVSGLAGLFAGPVTVTGAFTVLGPKSAAVRGADGGLRRLYSLESPESWFEDFGSGQLSKGNATVQLAADFAAVVHSDAYHVFLTPRGESNSLYISKQSPGSFTVQEAGGGTSNIAFSYRVVAKRKDIAGTRLEHVDEPPVPDIPQPFTPQALPVVPLSPKHGG